MLEELHAAHGGAVARDDGEAHALAQTVVRDGIGGGLEHARVLQREVFDVRGMDVVAAADDEVFLAADDLQIAVRVEAPEVAAHEPAAALNEFSVAAWLSK